VYCISAQAVAVDERFVEEQRETPYRKPFRLVGAIGLFDVIGSHRRVMVHQKSDEYQAQCAIRSKRA